MLATELALGPRDGHILTGAHLDQIGLELSDHAEHVEQQPPDGVGGVADAAAEAEAALVSEMASEVLRTRDRIAAVDSRLEELLTERPEAEVVRSMPGMGVVFTAEFLPEVGDPSRFASTDARRRCQGVVPVTRQSGGSSSQRRAHNGTRTLKRLLYMSSLSCTVHHAPSRAYYLRKRAEGKAHRQALVVLARRRVDVLWAMLRDGRPCEDRAPAAA